MKPQISNKQLDWLEESSPAPRAEPIAAPAKVVAVRRTESLLLNILASKTSKRIELRLNQNRSTWMAIRSRRGQNLARISLHKNFLQAPEEVILAVANLIESDNPADHARIDKFIQQVSKDEPRSPKQIRCIVQGRVYNLKQLMDQVCAEYFPSLEQPRITWGKSRQVGRKVSLGLYLSGEKLIRIHPMLDDTRVPRLYLEFVIYHELLHHILPEERTASGRCVHHSKEFRRLERKFQLYKPAMEFEKTTL